jgi:aspartate-semialdehyde dehydrogenase
MTRPLIAITHASSLLAEALIQQMAESGIKPDSVVLLDTNEEAGNRLAYADTYLTVGDQYEYDYEDLTAVLLLESDAELESLLQHCDSYVIGHHLGQSREGLFLPNSNLPEKPAMIKLPSPEVATLMMVITPLMQTSAIKSLQSVNILSAALYGKPGIERLASQTISLLNSKEVENSLFPLQLAFNMLPVAASAELEYQLITAMGGGTQCSINNILVPAMHGMAISVSVEFGEEISSAEIVKRFSAIDGVALSNQPVSPLTHCQNGTDIVIFELHQPQNDAKRLHFWIIADPVRNGLVQNYINILEVLLKSFL